MLKRLAATLAIASLAACDAERGPSSELSTSRSQQEIGVTTHRVRTVAAETATSATDRPVEGRVLELESSTDITVPRSNLFKVELLSNAGTGYGWTATLPKDAPLEQVGEPEMRPVDRGVMGGRVQWVFTFQPLRAGSCEVRFDLARPWEKGVASAKTATLLVTVQ